MKEKNNISDVRTLKNYETCETNCSLEYREHVRQSGTSPYVSYEREPKYSSKIYGKTPYSKNYSPAGYEMSISSYEYQQNKEYERKMKEEKKRKNKMIIELIAVIIFAGVVAGILWYIQPTYAVSSVVVGIVSFLFLSLVGTAGIFLLNKKQY